MSRIIERLLFMSIVNHTHSRRAVFAFKRALLQLRRLGQDSVSGPRLYVGSPIDENLPVAAESKTGFWTDATIAERRLQLGKVQNLRIALRRLNGIRIPAGETFSFWRQIGRATAGRGYATGRELREGCIIPSIGGGICQLSNALYDLALKADCEIVERHAHTRVVAGSAAEVGRDAAVAWNYIDLRFRPRRDMQIEAFLTRDELVIRFRMASQLAPVAKRSSVIRVIQDTGSCVTCGESGCERHSPELLWDGTRRTAFVLDAVWPEWQTLLSEIEGDVVVPIEGGRWRMPRYAWKPGSHRLVSAPSAALKRALQARRQAGAPPPVVRAGQLASDVMVAQALGRKLDAEHEHLIIAQSLLPGLQMAGLLGGRSYSVLMTRMPMAEVHRRLDAALEAFPDQRLLGDFRADPALVEAERVALDGADQIITPHPGIASLFPGRARLVPWQIPVSPVERVPEKLVVFAGPAAARKGAYAFREATRNLPIAVLGKNLEYPGFWSGSDVRPSDSWLSRAAIVVQPSICEERPVTLIKARAAGIPIVATEMCGLAEGEYHRVDFGDASAIRELLEKIL